MNGVSLKKIHHFSCIVIGNGEISYTILRTKLIGRSRLRFSYLIQANRGNVYRVDPEQNDRAFKVINEKLIDLHIIRIFIF